MQAARSDGLVADVTCGWDANESNQVWEGEFFPNISYIHYEVFIRMVSSDLEESVLPHP